MIVPERALAVYGTLAPGESNHRVVAGIDGRWVEAALRGHRFHARWRGMPGYPGFVADSDGPVVPVLVLVADAIADHWERLDDFEGPGYRRREIEVLDRVGRGVVGRAFVYETVLDGPTAPDSTDPSGV
jgi:gamma-glutamylcyclotransferase (GGCT)/AIG2-like uncharacterized protein YtfP